jgi:hypothetical protein
VLFFRNLWITQFFLSFSFQKCFAVVLGRETNKQGQGSPNRNPAGSTRDKLKLPDCFVFFFFSQTFDENFLFP